MRCTSPLKGWLVCCALPSKGWLVLCSLPFKGRAGVGMVFATLPCIAPTP